MPALPLPPRKLSRAVRRLRSSSASEARNDATPEREPSGEDRADHSGENPIFLSQRDPLSMVNSGSEPGFKRILEHEFWLRVSKCIEFTYMEMLGEVR